MNPIIVPETDIDPSVLSVFLEGGFGRALGLNEEDLRFALTVANARLAAGDVAQAITMYRLLILCDPCDIAPLHGFAEACLRLGDHESVLRTGILMMVLEPENPLGYYFAGVANLARADPDAAVRYLEQARARAAGSVLATVCERMLLLSDRLGPMSDQECAM